MVVGKEGEREKEDQRKGRKEEKPEKIIH